MIRSVTKFGGSSLADANCVARAASIVLSSPSVKRQHVVVSAPGKRAPNDVKVTDLFLAAHTAAAASNRTQFDAIFTAQLTPRFDHLDLLPTAAAIYDRAQNSNRQAQSKDFAASRGEYLNAHVLATTLTDYTVIDPAESFILFDPETRQLDVTATLEAIRLTVGPELPASHGVIIPGFYGSVQGSNSHDVVTFSRGGSDVTASLVAAALFEYNVSNGCTSNASSSKTANTTVLHGMISIFICERP